MSDTTTPAISSASFAELIEIAQRENWCVRPGCTTCGSLPFRRALREIPRDEIIANLRLMTHGFLANNSDMFRLIIWETSFLGYGGELLEPLAGTPAADRLRANIDYQNQKAEKRRAYAASQTPEAIADRRAKKQEEAVLLTAPHRERKIASQDAIRAVAKELDETPVGSILAVVASKEFAVSYSALGGLVYKRLAEHFRNQPILPEDLNNLSQLAAAHAGHWKKLLDRLAPPPA